MQAGPLFSRWVKSTSGAVTLAHTGVAIASQDGARGHVLGAASVREALQRTNRRLKRDLNTIARLISSQSTTAQQTLHSNQGG